MPIIFLGYLNSKIFLSMRRLKERLRKTAKRKPTSVLGRFAPVFFTSFEDHVIRVRPESEEEEPDEV